MSDDPFAAFKEGQPPAADEAKPAKESARKKRRDKDADKQAKKVFKNQIKAIEKDVAAAKAKKTRKPRQAKEMRLPISMLLEIGSLSEEESGALLSIGAGLQKLPKKSRGKIAAALGKIFG